MRIRNRLQRLEQRAAVYRAEGDADVVEIWVPYDGRGGIHRAAIRARGAGPW
jgi:hypothetical protein